MGGSILALRTVGGAWTSVRERIGYIWREGEGEIGRASCRERV